MTDIDRRMVLGGVAGAGLLLSGCKLGKQPTEDNGTDDTNTSYNAAYCEHYGDSARKTKDHSVAPGFQPDHICAVYVRYEANGRPTIRHAYYPTNAKTDAEIKPIAEMMLEKLRTDNPDDLIRPEKNFNLLSMNTQQIMVIFIDNDPAIIRFAEDNSHENVIRFTSYSGIRTLVSGSWQHRKMQPNFAFYNLRSMRIARGRHAHDLTYVVEYWDTNEASSRWGVQQGAPSGDWKVYAMNIHMLQAPAEPTAEVPVIPVVLDPDTGNMGSNP